jgi:hypothetical protein
MKSWLRSPLMDAAGDGDGGGGFDPAKFRTEIMGEVTRMFNGGFARIEKLVARPKPDPEPEKKDDDGGGDPGGDVKADPKVKSLEKKLSGVLEALESEKRARLETEKKAEEKERHSSIRSELSKYQFANDGARDAAFRIFRDEIKRSEDGSLVGGDDLPIGEFLDGALKSHEYLLAPKSAGGAGASAGGKRGGASVNIEDIRVGMKPEEIASVRAEIARVAKESLG